MVLSLQAAAQALVTERAWETRVVIWAPALKLLVFRRPSIQALWVEVWPLGEARAEASWGAHGLRRRRYQGGGRTFGKELPFELTAPGLAAELDVLLEVLNAPTPDRSPAVEVTIAAQRAEPPQNPALLEAMRAAANNQESRTRQRLYAALVNAPLLIPLEPGSAERPPEEQQPLRSEAQELTAFSDWDALRQWQASGHPFGIVHGTDFFAYAADQGCGVRINPDGVVGGALYPSEVQMMAEAVRGYLEGRS